VRVTTVWAACPGRVASLLVPCETDEVSDPEIRASLLVPRLEEDEIERVGSVLGLARRLLFTVLAGRGLRETPTGPISYGEDWWPGLGGHPRFGVRALRPA
jgi:hypothetical protein